MNILILIGFVFVLVSPFIMIFVTNRADANISKKIEAHNKKVILSYNQSSDLDEMWLKPKEFLKSKNGGEHPCEFIDKLKLVDYREIYNQQDFQERKVE